MYGIIFLFYFHADRYLGDHRFAYNQYLQFSFRVGEDGGRASLTDVVIEGDGLKISTPIYSQGNAIPRTIEQEYKFRLHDYSSNSWTPRLSTMEFMRLLSNITAIKIRGSYTPQGR